MVLPAKKAMVVKEMWTLQATLSRRISVVIQDRAGMWHRPTGHRPGSLGGHTGFATAAPPPLFDTNQAPLWNSSLSSLKGFLPVCRRVQRVFNVVFSGCVFSCAAILFCIASLHVRSITLFKVCPTPEELSTRKKICKLHSFSSSLWRDLTSKV